MYKTKIEIIRDFQSAIELAKTNTEYFSSDKDFSRNRMLTFEAVFLMILDLPKRSIAIELADLFELFEQEDGKKRQVSPSAFSQARKKILPKLFKDLNDHLLSTFYKNSKLKKWHNFILQAIDGSTVDLLNTEAIKAEFGAHSNQHDISIAQGRMMCLYDVLNGFTKKHHIGNLSEGESTVAKRWVSDFEANTLTIYDRLYPGMAFLFLHDYHKKQYVMRCSVNFNKHIKAFLKSKLRDKQETWILTHEQAKALKEQEIEVEAGTGFKVRLIKVKLKTGEEEILITSLLDHQTYPSRIFKKLYSMRWGVETNYGFLKNTLQIELTSGKSVHSIYQDFYATILRANLQRILEQDSEASIKKRTKKRKWKYQVNKNIAAGILKRRIVKLLLCHNLERFKTQYNEIKSKIEIHLCPIKPKRSFSRKRKSQKLHGKYKPMPNYKRAA